MPTQIQWCEETWNPVTGCTPISEGCKNCYAKHMANRLKGRYDYPKDDPFKVVFSWEKYNKLKIFRTYKRVFVCSMGDLFHNKVKLEWVDRVLSKVRANRKADFLILTKRPKNMWSYFDRLSYCENIIQNLWLGVTVESNDYLHRIDTLRNIPARVKFISFEPLLSSIPDIDLTDINWVIVGGESGPGARPMHPDWAKSLVKQCKCAGVPIFMKQMGSVWAKANNTQNTGDSKGHEMRWWPKNLQIRQFPQVHNFF